MNWFNRMMLVLLAFIGLMVYLIVRSSRASLPLVTEKYYEAELKYQDQIDKEHNEKTLVNKLEIDTLANKLKIILPTDFNVNEVSGNIKFYFPADDSKDKNLPLVFAENNIQEIDIKDLKGNYTIQVEWSYQGKSYYKEKKIIF